MLYFSLLYIRFSALGFYCAGAGAWTYLPYLDESPATLELIPVFVTNLERGAAAQVSGGLTYLHFISLNGLCLSAHDNKGGLQCYYWLM